jgi:hypothetical protein
METSHGGTDVVDRSCAVERGILASMRKMVREANIWRSIQSLPEPMIYK